ncbi:C-type lectin domain family 2 member D-like [Emydura macquarii macquarii]|uniref:C-type lectin domain family 2 member D-like n=1 Tax=Emydura macquarii macquarii TaxID=1129001 RepID=UPI00352B6F1A
MEKAVGPTYIQVPLQEHVSGNGHLESGGVPDPPGNRRKRNYKKCSIVLAFTLALVSSALLVVTTVLAVQRCEHLSADLGPLACLDMCPDGWIGYRGKCYYFSEGEGDWASSQNHCSALGASLAGINTRQDMAFMARYKGKYDHWIGLWRDPGQPWKWANGTEFNHSFPIGEGGGDCAYLNDQGSVSTSLCTSERYWICTKPDVLTKAKEPAVDGSS